MSLTLDPQGLITSDTVGKHEILQKKGKPNLFFLKMNRLWNANLQISWLPTYLRTQKSHY